MENLTPQEQILELEKCQNSFEYFYNNYCKRDGMPEYSEDVYKNYLGMAKKARYIAGYTRRGKLLCMGGYPLTLEECYKTTKENNKNKLL